MKDKTYQALDTHNLCRQHGFDCNHHNSHSPSQYQYQLPHHIMHRGLPMERKFTC